MLLKLGEIVLKGGNRQQFERMLQANIRRAIVDAGGQVRLWQRDGVIVLRVAQDSAAAAALTADRMAERARELMGVARVCRATRVAKDPAAAIDAAVARWPGKKGSFAVRARRRDKRFSADPAEAGHQDRDPGPAGVRLPGQSLPPRPGGRRRGGPA